MNAGELADKLEARWADSNSSEEDEIILKEGHAGDEPEL